MSEGQTIFLSNINSPLSTHLIEKLRNDHIFLQISDTINFMLKLFFFILLLIPTLSFSENVTVSINHDDGGKTGLGHTGCPRS